MTRHNGAEESDLLLVEDESWYRRHLPLVVACVIILALIALGMAWELTSTSASAGSSGAAIALGPLDDPSASASPDTRPSRPGRGPTTPPGSPPRLITVTVHAPPNIVVQTRTVTVAPHEEATRVVPDVVNPKLLESQAAIVLGSVGLTVNVVSDPAPAGTPDTSIGLVTQQDPAPGTVVPLGAAVTVHQLS